MSTDLLERARAGDGDAFQQLAAPHHRELHVHCYRILGSVQDAEDALQDTLLAAWRGLGSFEGRSSLRTWLYQVATNRCLNMLRANRRRPTRAYETGDVAALVALLTDDVAISMPPVPLEYHGLAAAAEFQVTVTFRGGRTYRMLETRANGQPAFGSYVRDPRGGPLHAVGLIVVGLAGDRIASLTGFDASVLVRFGFPLTIND